MASTRELRRRIKSIKATAQITKAMQLVSAAKMHKAQDAALAGKGYTKTMRTVLAAMAAKIDVGKHPLLQSTTNDSASVLFFTADRGFTGSQNTNLYKEAETILQTARYITIGKKGRNYVVKTKKDLSADFKAIEKPDLLIVKTLTKLAVQDFLAGKVGTVFILYTDFINTLKQQPRLVQLLPIEKEALVKAVVQFGDDDKSVVEPTAEYLFEPKADELLDDILNHYVEMTIYQAMLENLASEHSARMIAMKNATDNANDIVSDLTLSYNQVRQGNITKELLEITTAALAMNG